MMLTRTGVLSMAAALHLIAAGAAGEPARPTAPSTFAEVARRVDTLLTASWKKAGVEPAPPAEDAEFLRRVYLDIGGRIPSVSRVRAFLRDDRPDKRERVVDELLAGPYYVNHFAAVGRSLLIPEVGTGDQTRFLVTNLEGWTRHHLRGNTPYDVMVRDLITAPAGPNAGFYGNGAAPTALAFYVAKEMKAENLAASSARLFLGIKLECAQCHNHPFADWKRDQFWSFAAFFGGLDRQSRSPFAIPVTDSPGKEIKIPGTDRVVPAAFPDGGRPDWSDKRSGRQALAAWMTRPDNPYFARAAANRLWAHFLGSGLVDPVDEIVGGQSQPRQPEVLDELARQLVEHRFDTKFLIRAITATDAYRHSSTLTHQSQVDAGQFARMPVRGLTGEQLVDNLVEATGFRDDANGDASAGPVRRNLLIRFASQADKPAEAQTSILQALALMNGRLVADATSLERSETLAGVLDAPFLDTAARVEVLYLATLSRLPRPREVSRARQFVDAALTPDDETSLNEDQRALRYKHALADLFWALLNSGEFLLNH